MYTKRCSKHMHMHLHLDVMMYIYINNTYTTDNASLNTVAARYGYRMGLVFMRRHIMDYGGCLPRSILNERQTEANHVKKTGPATVGDGKKVPEVVGRCGPALTEDSKIHG